MKVKRRDWEALHARIDRLEAELRQARDAGLMQVETGPVLTSVVVPMILRHLKLRVLHGYSELQQ